MYKTLKLNKADAPTQNSITFDEGQFLEIQNLHFKMDTLLLDRCFHGSEAKFQNVN